MKRIFLVFLLFTPLMLFAQEENDCPEISSKKAQKIYDKAINYYRSGNFLEASKELKKVIEIQDDAVDAYFVLGLINYKRKVPKSADKYFSKVIELCPEYDPYTYFYMADIEIGRENWTKAAAYYELFLVDVDKIKSDRDYDEAVANLKIAKFYSKMIENPVPFNPIRVNGISTEMDEYLPIITPDNEYAFYTRRVKKTSPRGSIVSSTGYKETFMTSKGLNGKFEAGKPMPYPFNTLANEGGATLTIDNKELFYTVCDRTKTNYYNCDICYSRFDGQFWSEIQNLGKNVNTPTSWDSQPTISSDGKTLYFSSDRPGGYGGLDLYKSTRNEDGSWSKPVNLGPEINTPGHEKSPFIHTDSQTLYFSSADREEDQELFPGHPGLGLYDIFYSRFENGKWKKPKNIGYPINTAAQDLGFFVSTDGKHGFFASNKLESGKEDWNLYMFELYEEARPQKVLFIKGTVKDEKNNGDVKAKVELKNVENKKVIAIPVDVETGNYVAAVPFRNDYVLTVKKPDYAYESKYISQKDTAYSAPVKVNVEIKPIEVGQSYKLNDIYFGSNSAELTKESIFVLDGFIEFLKENPKVRVAIHGHTDNIGGRESNYTLSEERAKSVYNYIIKNGVKSTRLSYKGFGEAKAVASNETASGRAKNRRTEFVIIAK